MYEVIKVAKVKTNVMRILDKEEIEYDTHSYNPEDGKVDGISVSQKINVEANRVFKTLVTRGNSKEVYVFVIPVEKELNLKKAAKSVGEKSIEMVKVEDINKLTGYIRGGCSPIGMKKTYKTVIDMSASTIDKIVVSAGKIGYQVELNPKDIIALVGGIFSDISI